MRFLGLDLALTRSGWAFADGDAVRWGVFTPPGAGGHRLYAGRRWINGLLKELAPDVAVLEGYAIGAKGHQHSTAEFGGVIRAELYRRGVPYIEIPPATLKLYATGRGDAKKPKVIRHAEAELGYVGDCSDEADALWLMQMARDQFGPPPAVATRREILGRYDWPEVRVA